MECGRHVSGLRRGWVPGFVRGQLSGLRPGVPDLLLPGRVPRSSGLRRSAGCVVSEQPGRDVHGCDGSGRGVQPGRSGHGVDVRGFRQRRGYGHLRLQRQHGELPVSEQPGRDVHGRGVRAGRRVRRLRRGDLRDGAGLRRLRQRWGLRCVRAGYELQLPLSKQRGPIRGCDREGRDRGGVRAVYGMGHDLL